MDLIYSNENREDIGVILEYELDMAFGSDENNFECAISSGAHCCNAGYYLYIPGTEYGGIVDGLEVITESDTVKYFGRTWHGILESKIIFPLQTGETSTSAVTLKTVDAENISYIDRYLIISGDARDCIQYIITRCGLSDLFKTPDILSGVNINQYQFHRYTDAYSGIIKMLDSVGMKLMIEYGEDGVILSAAEKVDYSQKDEFDSDLLYFDLKKKLKSVNHLVCLGSGEMENRLVIHLYVDSNGDISKTQTFFGLDEYMQVYDYSNVESAEELENAGVEKLKELWQSDDLSLDLDDISEKYDIGDKVGALDNVTGTFVSAEIRKKIVTIQNGKVNISYEVGD